MTLLPVSAVLEVNELIQHFDTSVISCELANFTVPISSNWLLNLYGNITWHADPLTMHWCKIAHLLDKSSNMIYQLPQILPKQNTNFVHFIYCTNILNCPLNLVLLHGKNKVLPCQSTDRAHWPKALMSAPNTSMQQSGSNWQLSDPMAYMHRQIDSTLAQWCWGSSGGGSHISGWPCNSLSQSC